MSESKDAIEVSLTWSERVTYKATFLMERAEFERLKPMADDDPERLVDGELCLSRLNNVLEAVDLCVDEFVNEDEEEVVEAPE